MLHFMFGKGDLQYSRRFWADGLRCLGGGAELTAAGPQPTSADGGWPTIEATGRSVLCQSPGRGRRFLFFFGGGGGGARVSATASALFLG